MCSSFIEGHICICALQAEGFCVALLVELGFYHHSIKKIRSGGSDGFHLAVSESWFWFFFFRVLQGVQLQQQPATK